MQTLETWQTILLAVIEGLTEYLPVSSTGHIILGTALLGIPSTDQMKDFTVIIQFGAILSVLVLYRKKFLWTTKERGLQFLLPLFVGFLPAAVLGLLFNKKIDALLGDVAVVGYSLIAGGLVLLGVDRWTRAQSQFSAESLDPLDLPLQKALAVGFWQAVAMIPGVSRSGATIVGGMASGLNRTTAAEFSFFLAVPTLTAAGLYKFLKMDHASLAEIWPQLLIGNLVSFFVGMLAIKAFIGFLTRHGFFWFGIYRILIGAAVLWAIRQASEL